MAIAISGNSDDWNQVWVLSIDSTTAPLERQICPILLSSPVVAFFVNFPQPLKYRSCGFVSQKVQTGLALGGQFDARAGRARKVFIGELQVVGFEFAGSYALVFDLFTSIASTGNLIAWEYTGIID